MNARSLCASALLLTLAFASAAFAPAALAQGQPAPEEWAKETVPADKPFGDIPVDTAMSANDVSVFLKTLNAEQVGELRGRCGFIGENASDYDTQVVAWCKSFEESESAGPPAQ